MHLKGSFVGTYALLQRMLTPEGKEPQNKQVQTVDLISKCKKNDKTIDTYNNSIPLRLAHLFTIEPKGKGPFVKWKGDY